ncbi:transmembrane protein, putative (macronuclear) [Tetrahymena thermophila SB210]|uniref:Transmembrane protein, putative n=1 Tax=Tetrahymena thermophila (strain SB210) TaxID=312017 RepID=W7XCY5_TETTS|nr:transmembrane protein, putative [Tetrahymena thermophila SB210]7W5Z_6A Chain 6A, Transmembrane protein, putative [Tetrahymena thermophila]7W5Z_6a Chain 6a, Transmembrane protein, putative [Tetrahymena thermophila]8B6H_DE Chain DE, Transmembrane protein, putative [Tetrahymena thermophila SB210]8B6H_De Chain De, Transmembrane protein, putative [Tetrahymena thermophila SB210]8BQS_DE Chain DE, Transmembrane protein, putative [Tetrahymena thermophila SB210]8BQS_De Chain De, Transmembrane protei|eukprot:XP_012655782.1 transmembrane protein, putative [Tetrahymena thermophila SB210]
MIWKYLQRTNRGNIIQAGLQHRKFENLPFKQNFDNLTKAYDLRMWYISNSPHEAKNLEYVNELEALHNELNYQNSRQFLFRTVSFLLGWALFYQFYELPKTYDWQDTQEPKHQVPAYGDLEEGGDEGGDD